MWSTCQPLLGCLCLEGQWDLKPFEPDNSLTYPHYPSGSKDPNNRVVGPKYYDINGIWALKPCYLGPWTLRDY